MAFIPNARYQRPSVEVAPGEPLIIEATTLHVVSDHRGQEIDYFREHGTGSQRSRGASA